MVIYPGLRGKDDTFSAQDEYLIAFFLVSLSCISSCILNEAHKTQIAQIRARIHQVCIPRTTLRFIALTPQQ